MTSEELQALLEQILEHQEQNRNSWKALVHMLVDRKILKGDEKELMQELERRTNDVREEELLSGGNPSDAALEKLLKRKGKL